MKSPKVPVRPAGFAALSAATTYFPGESSKLSVPGQALHLSMTENMLNQIRNQNHCKNVILI